MFQISSLLLYKESKLLHVNFSNIYYMFSVYKFLNFFVAAWEIFEYKLNCMERFVANVDIIYSKYS